MSGDSDWMVDRRGWYAERESTPAAGESKSPDDAGDPAGDVVGYEAAYPSPLPAPASDRDPTERP